MNVARPNLVYAVKKSNVLTEHARRTRNDLLRLGGIATGRGDCEFRSGQDWEIVGKSLAYLISGLIMRTNDDFLRPRGRVILKNRVTR